MAVPTDYMKGVTKVKCGYSGGGGGLWGWKKRNQALLGTLSLMILSLILVLAWESTGPGGLSLLLPRDPQKLLDFRFGDAVKTHALWASTELLDESGERMLKAHSLVWREASEALIGLPSSHDAVQRLEGVIVRDEARNDSTLTAKNHSPLPTPSPITEEKASRLQPSLAVPKSPKKSPISRNALITEGHPSETAGLADSTAKSEVCDLSKGYWVKDENRPFYSGKECKAYLATGFACRLMTRPDFEFEKLRWQPEGCDLPAFSGEGFLHRLRNKVVAFVGDSLGGQQFQSLMCMITGGKDDKSVEDMQRKWGRETKWAYRFRETNTTVLFHWSTSLCDIEGGHPNEEPGYSAMHLDRPASFLKNFLHEIDVLILNTGHHWNRGKLQSNKWHQYVDGKPLVDRKLGGMAHALNFTVHRVVQWLDEKLADGTRKPAVFFRTLSPRHFKNGDWNSGGTCDSTSSHYGPKTMETSPPRPVYTGPRTDRVAEIAVRGTRLNLLNISHLSKFREEGHISKYGIGKDSQHQDCLHWCLPGVPDVWNELLYANLLLDPTLSPNSQGHR